GPERDAGLLAGMVYLEKGNHPEAMFRIRAAVDSSPENVGNLATLAYAYAAEGKRDDAIRTLNALTERSKGTYIEPGWVAMVWVALGNSDRAMELLERDYQLHSSFLMFVGSYPAFAPLHAKPQFRSLMHRVGLPVG
ncbi:MAG TPA: tetratricopeptide repeat protein, partial [Terriglobales bacterium]|nr:tetratricopeptide repeat protein [Terriglobales bacterium]